MILTIGNMLNAGSHSGKAAGFDISLLPSLNTTKATGSGEIENLVELLVVFIREKHPDLLKFVAGMDELQQNSRCNLRYAQ